MSVNRLGLRPRTSSEDTYGSDYDSDYEEALRSEAVDHLIARDIDDQVIYWINLLSSSKLSDYAILPVVTFKDQFEEEEVQRRCDILMQRLNTIRSETKGPQFIFDSNGSIPRLSTTTKDGIADLEECLLNLNTQSVFRNHFRTKISTVTKHIQNILSEFKHKGLKLVSLEHIIVKLAENPPSVENFSQSLVLDALHFLSSTGSIIYYGSAKTTCTRPHHLEDFVILCPGWLSNALSLVLRRDSLKNIRSKDEAGAFKFRQSLPILSHDESINIWDQTEYIRKVNNTICEPGSHKLYHFLQQLCEHSGIFVPLAIRSKRKRAQSYYLIPIFAESVPTGFWSYNNKDSWKTTLCNSFTFNDSISSSFIDTVAVTVLKNLFSYQNSSASIRIQQVLYWKTAIYAKVIEELEDSNRRYSHATEIFVQWQQKEAYQFASSNVDQCDTRKLIVSAKGYDGCCGEKIWNMAYSSILESIQRLSNRVRQREIFCPDCLSTSKLNKATVWDCNDISYGDEAILCSLGHEVSPKLLLGPYEDVDDNSSVATGVNSVYSNYSAISAYSGCTDTSSIKADVLIPAVVIVALWDKESKQIVRIGSGFIADNKRGLIITASHIFFDLENNQNSGTFGQKFYGLSDATALIGINQQGHNSAVFTYCADIIASDIRNVDGCVLQIRSKFERPVELTKNTLDPRAEIPITSRSEIVQERLKCLRKMTEETPRELTVRVLGYRQTGEGVMIDGGHINRIACVNKGFISKPLDTNANHSSDEFFPRSEIVVVCPTEGGNSGGPFVNDLGEVIGILSRVNPTEANRCYLTASKELKKLLKEAKEQCNTHYKNITPFPGYGFELEHTTF